MNDFSNFIKTPLAHRGLHDERFDENSLSAFKAAVEHGYGIELDVHLTVDGTLAVVHDNSIKRVTGLDRLVSEMTIEEITATKLNVSQEAIPTLNQVLAVVDGRVPLLIEMKVDGKFDEKLPESILALLENYPKTNKIAIESFNPYAIRWLSKNHKNKYPYGQLISYNLEGLDKFAKFMFKSLMIRFISKPSFLAFDIYNLPDKKISRLHRRGFPVVSWTIDNEEKRLTATKETDNYIFESIRP